MNLNHKKRGAERLPFTFIFEPKFITIKQIYILLNY